jgi:hypothetical protein
MTVRRLAREDFVRAVRASEKAIDLGRPQVGRLVGLIRTVSVRLQLTLSASMTLVSDYSGFPASMLADLDILVP